MIQDAMNRFSEGAAITTSAGVISVNVLDLGPLGAPNQIGSANATRDIGEGERLYVHIACTETFTASAAATMTITLRTDSTSAASATTLAVVGNSAMAFGSVASAVAAPLRAGDSIKFALPQGVSYKRYLGLHYNLSLAGVTGKFEASIVKDEDSTTKYVANREFS